MNHHCIISFFIDHDIVICSDGCGRTGTYSLIDMVLNRMTKGGYSRILYYLSRAEGSNTLLYPLIVFHLSLKLSPLQLLNGIWQNLTGSKYSTPYTKFVFFMSMSTKMGTLAPDWWSHFEFVFCNHWNDCWWNFFLSICWWQPWPLITKIFSTSLLLLNRFWGNMTGI